MARRRMKRRHKILGLKSNMRCWYCGVGKRDRRGKWTREHQEPKCLGGTGDPDNLVLACQKCNEEKADMTVEAYRYFLQDELPAGARVVFYGERCYEPILVEGCGRA